MTKTLTDRFMDNELDDRLYYFTQKMSQDNVEIGHSFEFNMVRADDGEYLDSFLIHEVLAPVPSYDEWQAELDSNNELLTVQKRLEKRLEIATKALKDVAYLYIYTDKDLSTVANNALKEMEGVK